MTHFKHISCELTADKLASGDCVIADIRDEQSYAGGHIEGAYNLSNGTLSQFIADTDLEKPVIVVCYHGVSSQGAAEYLTQQGFDEVYSMDGGFEQWRKNYPFISEN